MTVFIDNQLSGGYIRQGKPIGVAWGGHTAPDSANEEYDQRKFGQHLYQSQTTKKLSRDTQAVSPTEAKRNTLLHDIARGSSSPVSPTSALAQKKPELDESDEFATAAELEAARRAIVLSQREQARDIERKSTGSDDSPRDDTDMSRIE